MVLVENLFIIRINKFEINYIYLFIDVKSSLFTVLTTPNQLSILIKFYENKRLSILRIVFDVLPLLKFYINQNPVKENYF